MKVKIMRHGYRYLLATSLVALLQCGGAVAQFGELPAGAISKSETGQSDEIVLLLVFDPAPVKDQLPDGIRFRTLEEYATRDPAVAEYLRAHPDQRNWARGYFEIIRSASYQVDGRSAHFGKRGGMAVWYAYVARTDSSDQRPHGGNLLALGYWLSDSKFAKYMREKGYPVSAASVQFWQDKDSFRGRLKANDLEISGTCRPQGKPEKVSLPSPAYLTVWTPRPIAKTFEVLTGYGSMNQECSAVEWQAHGNHPLALIFLSRGNKETPVSDTEYESGYVLRSALYQRE
jgi:hypothetical protein